MADISRVSASPLASLGSLGSGVTVLGGSSSGLLGTPLSTVGPIISSAKERAAAAARRVPSPEPQPRKEKKKRLAWVDQEALVAVRWFRKVRLLHLGSCSCEETFHVLCAACSSVSCVGVVLESRTSTSGRSQLLAGYPPK